MKRITAIFLILAMAAFTFGCSSNGEAAGGQNAAPDAGSAQTEDQQGDNAQGESAQEDGNEQNMLVAYFTYGENAELPDGVDASASASIQLWNDSLTGNTGVVAMMIAQATGADMFSIQTTEKYPDTYDETVDLGREERNADARPQLASHLDNVEDYDVIFLGFPNWWGDMPMAVYSFLEDTDFSGKIIVPFVTSGGSGFSNTINTIESMEPDAVMEEGLSISSSDAASAQDSVEQWLSSLGYIG